VDALYKSMFTLLYFTLRMVAKTYKHVCHHTYINMIINLLSSFNHLSSTPIVGEYYTITYYSMAFLQEDCFIKQLFSKDLSWSLFK